MIINKSLQFSCVHLLLTKDLQGGQFNSGRLTELPDVRKLARGRGDLTVERPPDCADSPVTHSFTQASPGM